MKRNILCRLFGHKWDYKIRPGEHLASNPGDWFIKYCERCGEGIEE